MGRLWSRDVTLGHLEVKPMMEKQISANLASTSAGGRSPGTGGGDELMKQVNHVKTEW